MTDTSAEHKRARRRRARAELLKTIIIAALFVSMVTLASVEIVQTQRLSINPAFDVGIESLFILYGSRTQAKISNYILPEFMGYNISGAARGLYGGESSMRELYGLLNTYLSALLGGDCECRTLPAPEGDKAWRSCLEGDYIYVRYYAALPASALYCAASDKTGTLAGGDMPYVRELFISLKRSGDAVSYKLTARSGNSEVSVWQAKDNVKLPDIDISAFTAYNDSRQLADFSFLKDTVQAAQSEPASETSEPRAVDETGIKKENAGSEQTGSANGFEGLASLFELPDTTVLTEGEFTQKYITVNKGKPLADSVYNDKNEKLFLKLFGLNSDRVKPYESKGYKIYLGETGKLMLSDTGGLEYAAVSSEDGKTAGGIAVSSLLGYENYGGRYTYYELLTAAASMLDSLEDISPSLLGGDAYPGLVSVTGGETGLNLTFNYFYDNYRIVGLEPAVTLGFSGGKLVALKLQPAEIHAGELCVSVPQEWAVSGLYADIVNNGAAPKNRPQAELSLIYNVAEDGAPDESGDAETGAGASGESAVGNAETVKSEESAAETAEQSAETPDKVAEPETESQKAAARSAPVWTLLTGVPSDQSGS